MEKNFKIVRFVLASPLFLLLFLILPGLLILSRIFAFALPFHMTTGILTGNNVFLLIALFIRLLRSISMLRHASHSEATGLKKEARDLAPLWMSLVYAGLFLLLFVGIWDNLRQFSGTVIKGAGIALDLSQPDKYYHLITGPLASPSGFPLLKVVKQEFPGKTYPLGATEIKLYSRDGKWAGGSFIDAGKGPYRFGGYDIYLARLLADFALTIKTKGSFDNNVFDGAVKVFPLDAKKVGDFSLYGTFTTPAGDDGEAYFDPVHEVFRISLARKGNKLFETDFKFQGVYREKEEGNYVVSILGMGKWSEMHIVRRRHMPLIAAGAVIAAFGLLMRLFVRPRRLKAEG